VEPENIAISNIGWYNFEFARANSLKKAVIGPGV